VCVLLYGCCQGCTDFESVVHMCAWARECVVCLFVCVCLCVCAYGRMATVRIAQSVRMWCVYEHVCFCVGACVLCVCARACVCVCLCAFAHTTV